MPSDADRDLTSAERARLRAYRSAASLADLVAVTDTDSEHDAYFAAKRDYRDLTERAQTGPDAAGGLPGSRVAVDGNDFWVHGVTHADTDAEREFLQRHVSRLLDDGAAVYTEQGIRPMYFSSFHRVNEMDDYAWATDQCADADCESYVDLPDAFDGVVEDVNALAARFRDAAFGLIDAGGEFYGEHFEAALGDVATDFLTSHEDVSTATDFASFQLSREAARDPSKLDALQAYYGRAFLPQPVEREWLRRHDPELELLTHGRNERLADYAVYHTERARDVHLVVGAAHQPGVTYYLEQHRDGERSVADFELVR
ncbi:MAG: hypothetical protein ABEH83_02865 [Halobacterium sp.]